MRGVAQVDPAGFLADYTRSRLWTARIVKLFNEDDLGLRPGPGSMPTSDQVLQICQSDNFVLSLLNDEVPSAEKFHRDFDVSSVQACLASLKTGLKEVQQAIPAVSADAWQQDVEPFGPAWKLKRGQLAYLMIDHEAHHRGQLTVYLRVAGKTPPSLWEPVDESIFDL